MSSTTKSQAGERKPGAGGLSRVRLPMLQRECSCTPGKPQCESCGQKPKKKDTLLQRSPATGPSAPLSAPASVTHTLASPGRPLDSATRSFMEPRFGADFSGVRVHTDGAGAQSARDVNANAYTVGQHIVFDDGKYDPSSRSGKQLLGHELAHTVQQSGLQRSSDSLNMNETAEYHRLEQEAESVSRNVLASPVGTPSNTTRAYQPILSRASKTKPSTQPAPKDEGNRDWEDVTSGPLKGAGVKQIAWAPAGSVVADVAVNMGQLDLPPKKGDVQGDWDKLAQAGGLETIVDITGESRPKVALKQGRPDTTELKKIWIQKVGWKREDSEANWKKATKEKTDTFWSSATAKGGICHVDHIVELQFGGDNIPVNMQMLDGPENMSSGAQISARLKDTADQVRGALGAKAEDVKNIVLHYDSVKQTKATCNPCCKAEDAAQGIAGVKDGESVGGTKGEEYPLSAGGRDTKIFLVGGKKKNQIPILESDVPENVSASTLIPGMLLETLGRAGGPGKDRVDARFDTDKAETKTRLPLDFKKYKQDIVLQVNAGGVLKLDTKNANLKFDYGYLSSGEIHHLKLEDDNTFSGSGTITPSIKFLPKLQLTFDRDSFKLSAPLDATKLKSPFPGAKFTKGAFNLQLAPEFKPEAELEMVLGPANKPLATANVNIQPDSSGVVTTFKLTFHIPKMETAETTVTYRAGGGRDEWQGSIDIQSKNINLGPSIQVAGGFQGQFTAQGINFSGKITATLPGNNTAELGLKKDGDQWILQGKGVFHFKGLDETTAEVEYNLNRGSLYAKGKTGFHIEKLKLSGVLDPVEFVIKEGGELKARGHGKLKIERGKVKGEADAELDWDGKFSGTGMVSYEIKPNLVVTAKVKLDKDQKLRFDGELLLKRYELFEKKGDTKELFSVGIKIPVPGLSLGSAAGVMFHIKGGVDAGYSFGPGVIEPLRIAANFEPLEENPDLTLEVSGTVKVPASATLSAYIEGSLTVEVDVLIGSAGVEGGIRLQGDLTLDAGVFAKLDAAYKNKHLTAKVEAGMETKLLLGLSLYLFVHAWAGAFGLGVDKKKTWKLAGKTVDTGLGFYMSAPFEYADDKPFKFPEAKDVTLKKPDLTAANMKRIVGELFSSQDGNVD